MSGSVIEKVMIDISASRGIDESASEEDINWTQGLTQADNVIVSGSEVKTRKGVTAIPYSFGEQILNVRRLGVLGSGLGGIIKVDDDDGVTQKLFQMNETLGSTGGAVPSSYAFRLNSNDTNESYDYPLSEFTAQYHSAGSDALNTQSDNATGVTGTCITEKYLVVSHTVRSPISEQDIAPGTTAIEFLDKTTGNLVYTYYIDGSAGGGGEGYGGEPVYATVVSVNDRYVHCYVSGWSNTTGAKPRLIVFDTDSFISVVSGPTDLTSTANGDILQGAVGIANGSIAITSGSANRIERFNQTGTSQASAAISGMDTVSGLDNNGTETYVAGKLVVVAPTGADASALSSSFWVRGGYANPWTGTASAGVSGSYRMNTGGTGTMPSSGTAVNGYATADFNGTTHHAFATNAANAKQALSVFVTASAWTICAFVNPDASVADDASNAYNNPAIFGGTATGTANQQVGLTYTTAGFAAYQRDTTSTKRVTAAAAAGSWHFVCARYNGTSLQISVDGGAFTSVACGNAAAVSAASVYIGSNPGVTKFFDGKILEIATFNVSLSDTQVDDLRNYMVSRYTPVADYDAYVAQQLNTTTLAVNFSGQTDSTTISLGPDGVTGLVRIAADPDGNCKIIGWNNYTETLGYFYPVAYIYDWNGTSSLIEADPGPQVIPFVLEGSVPVYNPVTGKFYVNLISTSKSSTGALTGALFPPDVVADGNSLVDLQSAFDYDVFRSAAAVGSGYNSSAAYFHDESGNACYGLLTPQRPGIDSYGNMTVGVSYSYAALNRSFGCTYLKLMDPAGNTISENEVSAAQMCTYDFNLTTEIGFIGKPSVLADETSSPGPVIAGTYSYVAVWGYRDALGRTHYSRTSDPVTKTLVADSSVFVRVKAAPIGTKFLNSWISLYRTTDGGTEYHLVDTVRMYSQRILFYDYSGQTRSIEDSYADTDLLKRPILFRQPGTPNTSLDRYHALGGTHVIRHKDRVVYACGNNVYYSNFDVEGEAPWFSPAFAINVSQGSGPVTGLASMDGTMIVFKSGAVFAVDGDGPPENGGQGTEFTNPRQLRCEYGCIDPRSIVAVPEGVMYRSARGIELLDRGLKNVFIGRKVQRIVNAHPYTFGSTFDRSTGTALFSIGASLDETDTGVAPTSVTSDSIVLVYNTTEEAWTTQTDYFLQSGSPVLGQVRANQDLCYVESGSNVYFCHGEDIYVRSKNSCLDEGTYFVPWTLKTGWIHGNSKQDRMLVTDLLVLGQRTSNHNLRMAFRKNYDRTTAATSMRLWSHTETNINPEQLEGQPSSQAVDSAQFVVTTENPVGQSLGDGSQLSLTGLTVRLGAKDGGQKLSVSAK